MARMQGNNVLRKSFKIQAPNSSISSGNFSFSNAIALPLRLCITKLPCALAPVLALPRRRACSSPSDDSSLSAVLSNASPRRTVKRRFDAKPKAFKPPTMLPGIALPRICSMPSWSGTIRLRKPLSTTYKPSSPSGSRLPALKTQPSAIALSFGISLKRIGRNCRDMATCKPTDKRRKFRFIFNTLSTDFRLLGTEFAEWTLGPLDRLVVERLEMRSLNVDACET
mmetsp:Transcript_49517/g.142504  ORF Transcript_49517/g.142504 Transcript_49517/m.142504 type:complete len:225 (+) Transcript_49517:715-1389(+)